MGGRVILFTTATAVVTLTVAVALMPQRDRSAPRARLENLRVGQDDSIPIIIEYVDSPSAASVTAPLIPQFLRDIEGLAVDDDFGVMAGASAGSARSVTWAVRASVSPERLPTLILGWALSVPQFVAVHADPGLELDKTEQEADCHPGYGGTRGDVANALKAQELRLEGFDGAGVLIAIVDTRIAFKKHLDKMRPKVILETAYGWLPNKGVADGSGTDSRSHGTMTAYVATMLAPNAALAEIASPDPAEARLSAVHHGVGGLGARFEQGTLIDRAGVKYKGLIVNNSWTADMNGWPFISQMPCELFQRPLPLPYGTDSPCHIVNRRIRELERAGVDFVFAAGNNGTCRDDVADSHTRRIRGPNSLKEVLTVAAVTLGRNMRLPDSSRGPGVQLLGRRKPDISAFTNFLVAPHQLRHPNKTSAAAALTTGAIAALRSKYGTCATSAEVRTFLHTHATTKVTRADGTGDEVNGHDDELGYGVLSTAAFLTDKPSPKC